MIGSDDALRKNAKVAPDEAQTAGLLETRPGVKYSREGVLSAVAKNYLYLQHQADVDEIFKRFDQTRNGVLERAELKETMKYIEEKYGDHSAAGIVIEIQVEDEDVDWVLAHCDVTQEGTINKAEAVAAVALWRVVADRKAQQQQAKCCCEIL